MSELYTKFMERISPFLSQNWQMFVIAVGLLFLLGAVFNWKWLCNPQGSNPLGFLAFVYRNFGEKAHRVAVGIVSIVIIACGALLWGGECDDICPLVVLIRIRRIRRTRQIGI